MEKVRMKEIKTLFKFMGIRYFIDENGKFYKKVGQNHREQVIPFWKKRGFKFGVPLLLLVILGFVGYQVGMSIASEKVAKEIATQIPEKDVQRLLEDPTIQQMIEDEVGTQKKQEILNKYSVNTLAGSTTAGKESGTAAESNSAGQKASVGNGGGSTSAVKLKFGSKDEAMKFLLSKFTMSELMGFADKVKGGATPEAKSEIKNSVMKRLTPEEYDALKVFAILELSKTS